MRSFDRWSGASLILCVGLLSIGAQDPGRATDAIPVEAISGILAALRSHQVVGIGDAHGNVQGEALQLSLIRDPRFASVANDVLVEVGNSRHQALMDRFTQGQEIPEHVLGRIWRDTTQQQAAPWTMPAVFRAVREMNATVPKHRRLRVLLGEPPIDWDAIQTADQWREWQRGPLADRDRFASDVVRREVLAKNRRALVVYGAGHLFRKNETHSLISLLEEGTTTRAFTIWTNTAADLTSIQPMISSWPLPALVQLRGTSLGETDFGFFFGPRGAHIPDAWRGPIEDQFDALLYLGPPDRITFARPTPWPCDQIPERLRRLALMPGPTGADSPAERIRRACTR